jgi:hypothetical protein
MGLPLTDPEGRIYANAAGVPAFYSDGVAYDIAGSMCTTTTLDPADVYNVGWRLSNTGQVVVAAVDAPVFVNGLPFNQGATPGAMAVQTDQIPNASDPFQDEIRVGPNGVHLTSAIPP